MSLASPQFLFLIPLLFLAGWLFPRLALWRPLRVLLLLVLVVALCDPQIRLVRGGIDLWMLMDRSASARDMVDAGEDEWRSLLERSRPGSDNRLHLVDYATEVARPSDSKSAGYDGDRNLTRTALAIRDTLARMDPHRHNRLLLFTDGYSTEPLTGVAEKLLQQGVPLDYRELRAPEVEDFRVADFTFPERAQPGEPFVVDVVIAGTADGTVPLTVARGDRALFTREVEVTGGRGRFRFSDRITRHGAHRYRARIDPESDAHSGNDERHRWIEVVSGPRVVLVTNYRDDPLAGTLRSQGFSVETVTDSLGVSPGILTGARALVLNNVPAYELPNDFLEALDFFVHEQGGGLLMGGGQYSFGSGGYYDSAVDPLLPVSMELKSEHRRLAVAMGIVMDRSGSMGMTTPSGNSKMQLANEGAARAVELLGAMDAVTVFAVDSKAHRVTELLNVGRSRGELLRRVRSIESMGGGIFVHTGMKAGWNELKKADVGQRHMILFADAADAEEPGQYRQLVEEMTGAGATVSVIGLGSRGDRDAAFLQDIADRGGGRAFFTNVPGDLPNIFAQETVTVARSTFVEEPVGVQSTGRWYELAQSDIEWMPQVDGYNLSYLRDGDEMALRSTDSYAAPLVAFGRRGIGKTAAVSFPLGGDFSASTRQWQNYGDFLQTLVRWLMGEDTPPGIGLRHELTGTELKLDLLYDPDEWATRLAEQPPAILLKRGYDDGEPKELTWERLAPGHYSVRTRLRESEPVRGAVQVGRSALPFGPIAAGGAAEWEFDPERPAELRETARTSGGSEILDLTKAWRKPPAPGRESIRTWFLVAALSIFLLEALVTRTGWRLPVVDRWPPLGRHLAAAVAARKRAAQSKKKAPDVSPAEQSETPEPEPAPEAAPSPEEEAAARRRRFSRAKKRR